MLFGVCEKPLALVLYLNTFQHAPFNLILPYRNLRVDAAGEVEDNLYDNEERRAAERERGDAGKRLHHYRQYRYNAEEERADKGDAGDDVAQICFGRLAGSYAGYKRSVLLEIC